MTISREEQLRNNRRLARQSLGLVVIILVLIGLVTVFGWAMSGLRRALDDSDKKARYADRLYGLVMFDALPFEDVSTVDASLFKQAAIWGTVYQVQKNGGSLDQYERDQATGCVILPKLEVDTYITNLLGPDYPITDGAFETADMNYQYSEEKQGYLVPITGSVGLYTPEVEKITTKSGKTYVTVGYIPTLSNSADLTFTAPTEPTKFMDYVFTRGSNRQWYLSGLQESEMQPAASSASSSSDSQEGSVPTDPQALVESNLDATVVAGSEPATEAASDAEAASADTEAQPDAEAQPESEGDAAPAEGDAAAAESQPAA